MYTSTGCSAIGVITSSPGKLPVPAMVCCQQHHNTWLPSTPQFEWNSGLGCYSCLIALLESNPKLVNFAKRNYFRVVWNKMDCDVVGVGANNDLGEVQGVLGEEEMKQLKTQVRLISLPFIVDLSQCLIVTFAAWCQKKWYNFAIAKIFPLIRKSLWKKIARVQILLLISFFYGLITIPCPNMPHIYIW